MPDRPFRTADARAAGLERWRLETALVRRAHRDVFVASSAGAGFVADCAAAPAALPPGSVQSHHTAAALHGLPMPDDQGEATIHATVPAGAQPRLRGIRAHRRVGGTDAVVLEQGGLPPRGRGGC